MYRSWRQSPRPWLVLVATGLALVYSTIGASRAWSQTPANVVIVEEDWEVVMAEPEPTDAAPQITCTISPYQHLNNMYGVVEINHKTLPYWAGGGVHLQTWVGDYNLTRKDIENNAKLSTSGEVVNWTSRMRISDGSLRFSIINGNSTTWGTFGGSSTLWSSYGSSLTNLDSYSPEFSVQNSGIGFASNRVRSLTLVRVRYTLADGTVLTDDSPRVVHQSSAQLE
jgi:hypothetical protein